MILSALPADRFLFVIAFYFNLFTTSCNRLCAQFIPCANGNFSIWSLSATDRYTICMLSLLISSVSFSNSRNSSWISKGVFSISNVRVIFWFCLNSCIVPLNPCLFPLGSVVGNEFEDSALTEPSDSVTCQIWRKSRGRYDLIKVKCFYDNNRVK